MTQVAINIILILMVVPSAGFIYRYGRYSPWRATWQGIFLMGQKVALLLLVMYYLADAIFGTWPYQRWYLIAILLLMLILFWATFIGLVYIQTRITPVSRHKGLGLVTEEHIEQTKPRFRNLPPGKK